MTRAEVALVHHEWFEAYESSYRTPLAERVRDGRRLTVEALAEGRAGRRSTREAAHGTMETEWVDLWASPSTPGPAPEGLDHIGPSDMNRVWTYAGLPAVTVPVGRVDGLPVGLQLVGRFDADERVLGWAGGVADDLDR